MVASPDEASPQQLDALREYIKQSWLTLRRSNRCLLAAAQDPKQPKDHGKWPVYISPHENIKLVYDTLVDELPLADLEQLEIKALGRFEPSPHGILYLPHPYVVPGGRFNELYGWDSYFIVLGLLRDGEIDLARAMADDALYEVMHYGTVLNANRSYYLTRSQPPLLTGMVQAVFEHTHDAAWLRQSIEPLERYYAYWMQAPHLTSTGLSRFYDSGKGAAPEVESGESDSEGRGAYDRVRDYFRSNTTDAYDQNRFYNAAQDTLEPAFYNGDRAMRESGFDPSERFGPFNADVEAYNPVCLNTLLHAMEQDMARIHAALGEPNKQTFYLNRAAIRAHRIDHYNWDEEAGLFFDYNIVTQTRRNYPFATTFYPMWAGVATSVQAARIVGNLAAFEAPGGLRTSTNVSGNQWDAPFGWAPLHLMAVEGLRRYGYHHEADRISVNFLSLVLKHFIATGAIYEKYDVEDRDASHNTASTLKYGYTTNEVGFGWTNATFVALYANLSQRRRADVLRLTGIGTGEDQAALHQNLSPSRSSAPPNHALHPGCFSSDRH